MGYYLLIGLNAGLYVAALVTFIMGYGVAALICLVLALILTLILGGSSGSGGTFIFLDFD